MSKTVSYKYDVAFNDCKRTDARLKFVTTSSG